MKNHFLTISVPAYPGTIFTVQILFRIPRGFPFSGKVSESFSGEDSTVFSRITVYPFIKING